MSETAMDPFDPTVIAPGVVAIPLTPTPWDDMEDGQTAVDTVGHVWIRHDGLWYRYPWWQGADRDELIATCADPGGWAYSLGWSRAHVEEAHGALTPVTLPPGTYGALR